MQEYSHGGDIYGNRSVELDFSVNVNALGMPPAVRRVLVEQVDDFAHYPDPLCRELSAAIALHEALPQDMIVCGNGAADLIYRFCSALQPERALLTAPTFSEYERALRSVSCAVTYHTLSPDNDFLLTESFLDHITPDIDVIFLCNPNNPTGRLIPGELLYPILERARQVGATVLVDECFLDFGTGKSCKRWLVDSRTRSAEPGIFSADSRFSATISRRCQAPEPSGSENACHLREIVETTAAKDGDAGIPGSGLVVLKAFTKMYAMAGLRLGYLLSDDRQLLDRVVAAGQCWSVSVPAQLAGVAALCDGSWPERTRQQVAEEREYLAAALRDLGIRVFPSETNYLLLQSTLPLYDLLLQQGILIRSCANFKGLDESYFRIGIKTRQENEHLLQVIGKIGKVQHG